MYKFFILIYSVFSLSFLLSFSFLLFFLFVSPLCAAFSLLCYLSLSLKSMALCSALSLWSAVAQFVEVVVWGRRHFGGLVVVGLRFAIVVVWVCVLGGCQGLPAWVVVGLGLLAWVWWVWVVVMGFGGVWVCRSGLWWVWVCRRRYRGFGWVGVGVGLPIWVWDWRERGRLREESF